MTEGPSQINNLAELEQVVKSCSQCPLKESRTQVVFGVGSARADLLFVGEAPGFHEDRQGEPFVGAAGRLLDELLISVLGLTRKDIYIANVLKCRPPGNRDPLPEEIAHCRPFLDRQIALIDPRIICTLGNHATRVVLQNNINISRVHGQVFPFGGRQVFPTYHPAAALYAGATKQLLIEDFKKLDQFLAQAPASEDPARTDTEQMGLF